MPPSNSGRLESDSASALLSTLALPLAQVLQMIVLQNAEYSAEGQD